MIVLKYMSERKLSYADEHAVGFDIYPAETVTINAKEKKIIPLDARLYIPEGYWVLLALRSKACHSEFPLILSNGIGIIDTNYRRQLKAGVWNLSDMPYTLSKDESYFQGIIMPQRQAMLKPEVFNDDTGRDGFGSTDSKKKKS